jgi:hypothetical protein
MLRWSLPLVLASCTTYAAPDELVVEEPEVDPPARVAAIPDDERPATVVQEPVERGVPAEGIPADARIELARGACYGRCPVYRVVLLADGRVEWHGERFVEVKGDAEGSIAPATFARLWKRLNEEDFAKLPDEFPEYPSPYCPTYMTDAPTAIVSLSATGVAARVADYQGCDGNDRIAAFRDLEDRIDEVAGSKRWIGRCRTEPCH